MAAPRSRTLPRATPIGWEAEAPTLRLPVIPPAPDDRPAAAPVPPGALVAGVLALLVALALLGGLLELTGILPR